MDAERFEVIGVVAQSEDKPRLTEYLRTMDCTDEARTRLRVALVSDDVRQSYKLTATPITLIVNNDGTVEKTWPGRWNGTEAEAASTLLGFNISPH